MSTRRTRPERISVKRAELIQMQNELKRLEREEKEAERKARTKRLCKRAGFIESILPDTITLSDDRFEKLVKMHFANVHGAKMLNDLLTEQEKENATQTDLKTVPGVTMPVQVQSTIPTKAPPSPYIEDDGTDG